jgi:hypothetical protein
VTKKLIYSLKEVKDVRDKLAELCPEVSEESSRWLQELQAGMQNALRAMQEALAPWADRRWARKHVVDMALRTLSEAGPDSKVGEHVRDCLGDLRNLFATLDADVKMEPATRGAMEEIIANVLFIGLASNDPNDLDLAARRRKDFKQKQAAALRKKKGDKFAPRVAKELDAVRAALEGGKPVDTLKKARGIEAAVARILGKKMPPATIRRRLKRLASLPREE